MRISSHIAITVLLAVQAQAAPTLTDLWNGQATWVKDTGSIGSSFGFHFVSILPRDQELWAYYIGHYTAADGRSKLTIARARGTDGINWSNDGMVLDVGRATPGTNGNLRAWDDRLTSFPGVWKDGDTWYLVYEGAAEDASSPGDIGLATSTDGRHFVKHPNNPILRHYPSGWERANIGTPSLYKEKGIWYLFYHGYDGNVCQIGVASGTSLTNLTKSAANPILPVTAGTAAWDTGTIGRRSAIAKEGAYYYFAFQGRKPQPSNIRNRQADSPCHSGDGRVGHRHHRQTQRYREGRGLLLFRVRRQHAAALHPGKMEFRPGALNQSPLRIDRKSTRLNSSH